MVDSTLLKEVKVAELVLDTDNPRFFHLRHRNGKAVTLTQDDVEKEIIDNDEDIPLLTKSIRKRCYAAL